MITGLWTALPNIYRSFDEQEFHHVLEYLFLQGIDGLFLLGTTGRGTDFSVVERMGILEKTIKTIEDPKKIVVAISANAPLDVRNLAQHAMELGVKGVALTPPYYGQFSDQEIQSWAREVFAGLTKKAGIYLYNIPGATRTTWSLFSLDFVHQIIGVDGIKDSSGDVKQLLDYLDWSTRNKGTTVLAGDEHLTMYHFIMGGHGIVSGLSSAYPKLLADLVSTMNANKWEEAIPLQREVNQQLKKLQGHSPRETVEILIRWMKENMQ